MISVVNEFLDDLRGGRMSPGPVVRVEQGELQGRVANTPSGKAFYSFQGIPYAKPPLGSLRFKAPQPAEPWEGVRDATSEGNVSAQINRFVSNEYVGDENCLFLNIYTPNLDGAFLPVMVYFHGGYFLYGSGNTDMYGPDYLVEKDVVVVTLNYRLGVLGFLCLNTPEVPGNAGIKDMVLALKWVKENIHNFGGNAGNLTIFGESAGGAATSVLSVSPLSKHLISKVAMQSGNGLCSWAIQKNPIESAVAIAKLLGCEAENVDDILEFLTATPAKDIVEAHMKLNPLDSPTAANSFVVAIEKEFSGVEAVITESFLDLLSSGRVAQVPVLIGNTSMESYMEHKAEDLKPFIPQELKIEKGSEEESEIANRISKLYFKDNVDEFVAFSQLLSDSMFNRGTYRYVQNLSRSTNAPIYYYQFDYVGELNIGLKLMPNYAKSEVRYPLHLDDVAYLFRNDLHNDVEPTPQDLKTRERMVRLWTNFAKTGNPTPEENHYINVTWQPVTKEKLYYLNIGDELALKTDPFKERMDFWDEIYNKYFKIWDQPKVNDVDTPRKILDSVVTEVSVSETSSSVTDSVITSVTYTESSVTDGETVVTETLVVVKEGLPEEITVAQPTDPILESEEKINQEPEIKAPEVKSQEPETPAPEVKNHVTNGIEKRTEKPRTSNEIKMVQNNGAGAPKDVIRANDPPEDDLPKNIGVNKFVNFFESLGGKKK